MRAHTLLATCLLVFTSTGVAARDQEGARHETSPMAAYLQRAFAAVSTNLLAAAEMMPAEDYAFRPAGVAPEVRTFAQLLGHTLEVYSFICAAAKEEKDPLTGTDGDRIMEKARIVELLKTSIQYCSAYHASLTDRDLAAMVKRRGTDGRERLSLRANMMVFNIAHANEHYGNLVTYLRLKGIVPPSSEPRR